MATQKERLELLEANVSKILEALTSNPPSSSSKSTSKKSSKKTTSRKSTTPLATDCDYPEVVTRVSNRTNREYWVIELNFDGNPSDECKADLKSLGQTLRWNFVDKTWDMFLPRDEELHESFFASVVDVIEEHYGEFDAE